MADVIDAFVVSLGLDPSQYNREIKKYRDDRKRLDEEDAKSNTRREEAQTRLTDGMRKLRNETAGFLLMMAGANSVKDFANNIIAGDAATSRMARSLGMATEQLGAWQGAIKDVGGSAADINKALGAMQSAYQSARLTGTTGHDADFQGLGVTAKDLQDPQAALLKIAGASDRMPRQEFGERLGRIGFDQYTIDLLARGRGEVTKLLGEQAKLYKVTQQNGDAAENFEKALGRVERAMSGKVRPELTKIVEGLGDWLEKGDNLNTMLNIGVGVIGAFGLAAAAASWELLAIAGAIAGIVMAYEKIKKYADDEKAKRPTRDAQGNTTRGGHFVGDVNGTRMNVKRNADGSSTGTFEDAPLKWVQTGPNVGHWEGKGSGIQNMTGLGPRAGWTVTDQYRPAPAGGAPAPASGGTGGGGDGQSREDQILGFFRSHGFSAAQARGMLAAMKSENASLDPTAHNRAGGGQGAYGLGQWRGTRLAALRERYGPNPTAQQQLQFMLDEMGSPDGGGSGVSVRGASSSSAAAKAMIDDFYRPGRGTAGDYARAGRFLGQPLAAQRTGGTVNQSTTVGQVNVYTTATHADGIARDMRQALANRGLVTQANTGLMP